MKKLLYFWLLCCAAPCFAQAPYGILWQDTSWTAHGQNGNEEYGFDGLSYLGKLDTAQNAIAVGESGGSSWILNRTKLDTGTVYFAPGQQVIPCNLSGSGRGDYAIINPDNNFGSITILYSTDTVFDTALVLTPKNYGNPRPFPLIADLDSSGIESLYLLSSVSSLTKAPDTLIVLQYVGGAHMSTIPQIKRFPMYHIGGNLTIGHPRDTKRQYLCSINPLNDTTAIVYFNPLGRDFSFIPTDSVILNTDSSGGFAGGFLIDDADTDNIDDIFLGYGDRVLIYKGGQTISPQPSYYLTDISPSVAPYLVAPGTQIIDVGNVVSPDYHSVIVTDPQYGGSAELEPGSIFLYNIGKGLKDTCVAFAIEGVGTYARLGTQVIGIGKYPGQRLDGFMAGEDITDVNAPFHGGQIIAFKGNASYGPNTIVQQNGRTAPVLFNLEQNYPNPFFQYTDVTFGIEDSRLYGEIVSLKIYNILGKEMLTAYSGVSDNYQYTIRIDGAALPAGVYYVRLACGGQSTTKMMNVVK